MLKCLRVYVFKCECVRASVYGNADISEAMESIRMAQTPKYIPIPRHQKH